MSAVRRRTAPAASDLVVPVEEERDRRRLRAALGAAAALHLALFGLPAPSPDATAAAEPPPRPVTVLRTPRFRPPPQPISEPVRREVRAPRLPIPGPAAPEPALVAPVELPAIEERDWTVDLVVDVPAAPPPLAPQPTVYTVGGDVSRPQPLHQPLPPYTEAARRGRVEGPVVLEVLLRADGLVETVEVRSGLPFGLTASAAETVSRWRYEPARLDGRAVPVRMVVTVHFELQ